jgi:endonuclease/exonuclease/phosphatase family metal-dependent hydrolase
MRPCFRRSTALALTALGLTACQITRADRPSPDVPGDSGAAAQGVSVPPRGAATTLDIASWNVEWFGDSSNGPTNEAVQLSNVRDVIGGTDFDLWGLEEVVSTAQFNDLVAQLPGYAGLLANDPSVVSGPAFYSDFSDGEQKVGLVYKTSVASVLGAAVILTQNDLEFAGRPPLEIKLRVTLNGRTKDLIVIVMHPKCCADAASYDRRVSSSRALKAYLDATYPTQQVWVIGDWNDDVDTSIFEGQLSPYQDFVADSAHYFIPTTALSETRIGSTVHFSDTIDHHMTTDEAAATYIAGSAEVYRVDAFISKYGTTTSDHYPVLTRYAF